MNGTNTVRGLVAGSCLLVAMAFSFDAAGKSGCWFLECPRGEKSQALPPATTSSAQVAPPLTTAPPPPSPPSAALPKRQRGAGETCRANGNEVFCVSSVLAPQRTSKEPLITYGPENLFDGKYTTAWSPDTLKAANGIGEVLTLELADGQTAAGIQILNGYRKNPDIYAKNNRVKQMEVRLRDGRHQLISLSDTDFSPQSFQFDGGPATGWVQLKIVSVYPGTKYQDTAITEVRLVGTTS